MDLLPPPLLLIGRFAFNRLNLEAAADLSPAAPLGLSILLGLAA